MGFQNFKIQYQDLIMDPFWVRSMYITIWYLYTYYELYNGFGSFQGSPSAFPVADNSQTLKTFPPELWIVIDMITLYYCPDFPMNKFYSNHGKYTIS